MADRPCISLTMMVYDGERYIADALESVMRQQERPDEIIVLDDGSTDTSAEIAAGFPGVRVVRQENSGPPAARNRCLTEAGGDLICMLDCDDVQLPHCLTTLKRSFEQDAQVEIVIGKSQLVTSVQLRDDGSYDVDAISEPFHTFAFGAALVRTDVFEKVGSFDETAAYCDDLDWFMRAREAGCRIEFIRDTVLYYRIHRNNLTRDRAASMHGMLKMLHGSLKRRKEQGEEADLPRLGIDNRLQIEKIRDSGR